MTTVAAYCPRFIGPTVRRSPATSTVPSKASISPAPSTVSTAGPRTSPTPNCATWSAISSTAKWIRARSQGRPGVSSRIW
ncbi:MAG: hypothetical protein R3F65_07195 [bacterium]